MVRTFLQAKAVSPLDVSPIMISLRHLFAVYYFFVMRNKVVMELKYAKKSQLPFSALTNQNAQGVKPLKQTPSNLLQGPFSSLCRLLCIRHYLTFPESGGDK